MAEEAVTGEPPVRRFRWLKRTTLGVIAAHLLLALAWYVTDRVMWSRIETRMAAYRAAGEPTTIEELKQPPVPPERNAALLYLEAYEQMAKDVKSPLQSDYEFDAELPPREEWLEMTRKARAANGAVLELVLRAKERPEANWGTELGTPLIETTLGPEPA